MITIGTRASALALTQSRQVAGWLGERGHATVLQKIVTQGDRVTHLALDKLAGKGFFTKEIEEALLARTVDVAVHSLKDLPGEATLGLVVESMPPREDPRDVMVVAPHAVDDSAPIWPLRHGARVGTSAVRRKAQLLFRRPDLQPIDIRGNVPTRLAKVAQGTVDAVVLAYAGLRRLSSELGEHRLCIMDVASFVPAPGQGALGLQCRADDVATRVALRELHDVRDAHCVHAERRLLQLLHAGCHVPLGASARRMQPEASELTMSVFFGGDDSRRGPWRIGARGADADAVAQRAFAALTDGAPVAGTWIEP